MIAMRRIFVAGVLVHVLLVNGCQSTGRGSSPQERVYNLLDWFNQVRFAQDWDPDAPGIRAKIAQFETDKEAMKIYLEMLGGIEKTNSRSSSVAFLAGFLFSRQARVDEILEDRLVHVDDELRADVMMSLMRHRVLVKPSTVLQALKVSRNPIVRRVVMRLSGHGADARQWDLLYRTALQDPDPEVRVFATYPPFRDAQTRAMVKEWLREAIRSAPPADLGDDVPMTRWRLDIRQALEYLHDCYAICETRYIMQGGLGQWAQRALRIADCIDNTRERLEKAMEEECAGHTSGKSQHAAP